MKCEEITPSKNQWQYYSASSNIEANSNAIAFANFGTNAANINGFDLQPGICISLGGHQCELDCTPYRLNFATTGAGNKVGVIRGNAAVAISNFLSSTTVTGTVKIQDSAGNTITAIAGKLQVQDAAVATALATLDTDLNAFKTQNNTNLTNLDTDLNAFKSANHADLLTVITNTQDTSNRLAPISGYGINERLAMLLGQLAPPGGSTTLVDLLTELTTMETTLSAILTQLNNFTFSANGVNVDIKAPLNGSSQVETHNNP